MAETVGIFFSANVEAFKVYYSGIFFLIPGLFRRCHLIRSSFLSHHVSIKPTYLYHDVPCGCFSSLKRCKESRGGTEQRFRVFFFFFGCLWMKRAAVWISFIISGFGGLTASLQRSIFSPFSLNLAADQEWLMTYLKSYRMSRSALENETGNKWRLKKNTELKPILSWFSCFLFNGVFLFDRTGENNGGLRRWKDDKTHRHSQDSSVIVLI